MTTVETVEFYSEGCKIAADIYIPAGLKKGQKIPGIVLCHGYTGVKDLYLPDTAKAMNAAGYVALAFDFKGWGLSDGPRFHLDPHGRVADTQAALTYLSLRPEVDAEKLGLFGWSFGCSVGVWLAAIDDRLKAMVGVVGVANGERWLKSVREPAEWERLKKLSEGDRMRRLKTGESEVVDRPVILYLDPESRRISAETRKHATGISERIPLSFVDETIGFNPEWVVGKIAPRAALFIGCENDQVVYPEQMESLYKNAGEPKKLIMLEGHGHYDVYGGLAFRKVLDATIAWYNEHIPPAK